MTPSTAGGDDEIAEAELVEEILSEAVAGAEADRAIDAEAEAVLGRHAGAARAAGVDLDAEEAMAEAVELARRFEAERDEYLDMLRRLQAEFENYKRRVDAQRADQRAQAAADLVRELLPVLDAGEAAIAAGHGDVEPVHLQLRATLEKQGLTVLGEAGAPFDPNVHEAVLHEQGDGEPQVAEVLRTGYAWNDRVVRAAMVKVRG